SATLWAAVSRAVRTPSRIDRELFAPAQPPYFLAGGPGFHSEEALAYELGFRHQQGSLALSVATFYSRYHGLRSLEQVNPPAAVPLVIGNGQDGESFGAELTAEYLLTNRWRVWGGRMALLRVTVALLLVCAARLSAQAARASEAQVKAVFMFNFAQFVDWPAAAFPDSETPLVIGILGDDPFEGFLDQTIRGEQVRGRVFQVRRYHSVAEIKTCHILFISRPPGDRLDEITASLRNRPILTVSEE